MMLLCSEIQKYSVDIIYRNGNEKRYMVTFIDDSKNEITLSFSAFAFSKLCAYEEPENA
jgi:hypothetical protein